MGVVKWFLRGGGSFLAAQGEATWHRTCNCSSTGSTHLWWRCLFFDCESRKPRDSAGMHQAERAGGKVYSARFFFQRCVPGHVTMSTAYPDVVACTALSAVG